MQGICEILGEPFTRKTAHNSRSWSSSSLTWAAQTAMMKLEDIICLVGFQRSHISQVKMHLAAVIMAQNHVVISGPMPALSSERHLSCPGPRRNPYRGQTTKRNFYPIHDAFALTSLKIFFFTSIATRPVRSCIATVLLSFTSFSSSPSTFLLAAPTPPAPGALRP